MSGARACLFCCVLTRRRQYLIEHVDDLFADAVPTPPSSMSPRLEADTNVEDDAVVVRLGPDDGVGSSSPNAPPTNDDTPPPIPRTVFALLCVPTVGCCSRSTD